MNEGSRPTFKDLSDELIVQILHFCKYNNILYFSMTCKRYYHLVVDSVGLQLHIELEANGLEIADATIKGQLNTSYSLILDDLRRYQDAWLDLTLDQIPIEHSLGEQFMRLWELREGLFIKAFSSQGDRYANSLQMFPLSSPHPLPPINFQFNFCEFTLDPKQELAVLVGVDPECAASFQVHIRSTITGLPHPLARRSLLTVKFTGVTRPTRSWSTVGLDIMKNILSIKFSNNTSPTYEVLTWNWTSGVLLGRISSNNGICDFTFLDGSHLVLYSATHDGNSGGLPLRSVSLQIFVIPVVLEDRGDLTNAHFDPDDYPILPPILTFELPQLHTSHSVYRESPFLVRSDPTPGRTIHVASAAFACTHAITLGLTLTIRGFHGDYHYRVIVSGFHLLKHLEQCKRDATAVLPWSKWGEQATRWSLEDNRPDDWICWISGPRYIIADHSSHPRTVGLSVVDFHTQTIRRRPSPASHDSQLSGRRSNVAKNRRALRDLHLFSFYPSNDHSEAASEGGSASDNVAFARVVDSDTPTVTARGFKRKFFSRLPFRIVTRKQAYTKHDGWLIDGNHIIGVEPWDSPDGWFRDSETISIYKLRVSTME